MMAETIAVNIVPAMLLDGDLEDVPFLVSIEPEESTRKGPINICCLIDVGWHTQAPAFQSQRESLTKFDFVLCIIKNLIWTLDEEDTLAIVYADEQGEVLLEPTVMNKTGGKKAENAIHKIKHKPCLYSWPGVAAAFDSFQAFPHKVNSHLLLLTNCWKEDDSEIMFHLADWKTCHDDTLPCSVHALCTPHNDDENLLCRLAEFGGGSYTVVLDYPSLHSSLVCLVGNLRVTMASDCTMVLEPQGRNKINQIMGCPACTCDHDGNIFLQVGCLQHGQNRKFAIRMDVSEPHIETPLVVKLECISLGQNRPARREVKTDQVVSEVARLKHVVPEMCQAMLVDAMWKASVEADKTGSVSSAWNGVVKMVGQVRNSSAAEDKNVVKMVDGIMGRFADSLSSSGNYLTWGRQYILSVVSGHRLQQRSNTDPSLKIYGSQLFRHLCIESTAKINSSITPGKSRSSMEQPASVGNRRRRRKNQR